MAKHTITMKVYFLAVVGFEESKLARGIDAYDSCYGWALVMLDLILRTANLILKLAPSVLKGVVNRECQVGMPLVGGRGPCHIDFSAVGNGETYMDFVLATLAVPLTGSFHNDTACGYAAPAPFKFGQVRIDSVFNLRCCRQSFKHDLRWRLHGFAPTGPSSLCWRGLASP
jgi:hypothetical protein